MMASLVWFSVFADLGVFVRNDCLQPGTVSRKDAKTRKVAKLFLKVNGL